MTATTAKLKILLADDEVEYARSLARVLGRRGVAVTVVHDGVAAVEAHTREEFDVIVLDLRMPLMDGLEALAAIRNRDALTPVVLLSGQIDIRRARDALVGGATDVLQKPCPVETLMAAIEDAADRKRAASPAPGRGRSS